MGNKFSALKKIRKVSKQAQCPSTLNETTNEFLSWKDDYAVPSSNGVGSAQFDSVNTSSVALLPIPELETETAPITLPKLCTELILDIAEYLPPSSHMSLSYTCRTICNKMGVSFAQVLGDRDPKGRLAGSTLSIESRNVRYLERLELWSMLVRDGKIPRWHAWFIGDQTEIIDCWIIKTPIYLPISTEHRCLGTAGLLWVCPHQLLDYDDATMGRRKNDSHRCGSNFVSPGWPVVTIWSIMMIPANSVPTSKEVVEALHPLNAPVCPHLRLNDASVARIYESTCRKLRPNKEGDGPASACRCSNCYSDGPLPVICSYCNTTIRFSIQLDHRDRLRFDLLIMRTTRLGRSCMDRDWIAQVARPTDLEDYRRAWEATNAECSRRGVSLDDF